MSDKCLHCSRGDSIRESRKDAYQTANTLLLESNLPHDPGGANVTYSVADVMTLACFLLGMGED